MEMKLPSFIAYDFLNGRLRKVLAVESGRWRESGPWRFPSVCYTLEHKLAFLEREHYLTGHYSLRGIFHDWEKPFLYLCPWLTDEKKIQKMHRQFSPHHVGCRKTASVEHLIEMYIDWDCAAITKPDKPLNAFETLVHFYPEYISVMLPVCLVMDIASVKSEIYIHAWHELAKDEIYNRQIHATVKNTVDEIIRNFPSVQNGLRRIELKYRDNRQITRFSPAEIFILTLLKQQDNLDIDIDMEECLCLLRHVSEELAQNERFMPTRNGTVKHHYKQTVHSPFAVS